MTTETEASASESPAGVQSPGYLATTLGTLIGANVGGFGLGLAGALLAIPLLGEPSSGGWEALIGAVVGFGIGFPVGGALGCLVALRVAHQPRRGRTALVAAGC